MGKTYGVLIMRDVKLLQPEDFLELLFWNKRDYTLDAIKILQLIGKRRINRKNWKDVVTQLSISKSRYYYILRRLRSLGLVYREEDEYRLSERFSKNLERIAEYWEELKERLEK